MLENMLSTEQHGNLREYLGRASAFDYVQFDRVFDLTHLSVAKADMLQRCDFRDPSAVPVAAGIQRVPYVGMVQAWPMGSHSFEKFELYLHSHAMLRVSDDGIDVW